ncbi:MAG: hypothetical protein ACI808_000459 [Paraglaciecola sp.]|jgi:hypothetical protein
MKRCSPQLNMPQDREEEQALATAWARKAQESGYYCMREKDGSHPQFDAKRWRHVG